MKKSEVEISVFLIIDLPKYHFLHHTGDNPSFESKLSTILMFLFPIFCIEVSDDYTRLPSNNVVDPGR